jgi:Protein of unknown function (DUF3710)
VGIFRRGNKSTSTGLSTGISATDDETGADSDDSADSADELAGLTNPDVDGASPAATQPTVSRDGGPFDRSEVGGLEGRLDLGAIWLTGTPGMELRLEVDEQSQEVVGVTAVLAESAVQLQAFAAPRSEGVWDDIRTEIAASITSQGGTADKASGPFGTELRAQMPGQGPDGRTVFSPVRFVGVDGPRWFLRAVLSGPAAADESAASALLDVVRATVVVRGDEAMAPRELLPLKLPEQQDVAAEIPADGDAAEAAPPAPSLDDFKPFERGPEITEIH